MDSKEREFLQSLEKKLWTSADKLRSDLDVAVYKHVVLGLIFIKYISDAFGKRQDELEAPFQNPVHDDFLGEDAAEYVISEELELRDFYTEQNVFWVPEKARWKTLQDCAKLSVGARLPWGDEFKGVGRMLDDALEAIEKENPKLKGVLNKDYARLQLESGELIDLIATIPFHHETMKAKDILGHVSSRPTKVLQFAIKMRKSPLASMRYGARVCGISLSLPSQR
jgi:type I restriction enzyme M protein